MKLTTVEGSAIAAGDPVAIKNLLEIFAGLLEFILGKISEGGADEADYSGGEVIGIPDPGVTSGVQPASTDDDDADIPSFLRAEEVAPPSLVEQRRRSVGSILPFPVAQSSLQSSKQSSKQNSDAESVQSHGTSTVAIVKESEQIAERLGLRPTDESLEATTDIGRDGIEKAMKAQEEMRQMLARWTRGSDEDVDEGRGRGRVDEDEGRGRGRDSDDEDTIC